MGYLVRKADAFLREWKKNPDRKPLNKGRKTGRKNRDDQNICAGKL